MLGILFLYFIGKYYYKLAEKFNKNKWLYAILGVVIYYAGTMIGGMILGFADVLMELNFNWENNLLLSVIALPFGIGATYLVYFILKKQWEKNVVVLGDEIQEIGKRIE